MKRRVEKLLAAVQLPPAQLCCLSRLYEKGGETAFPESVPESIRKQVRQHVLVMRATLQAMVNSYEGPDGGVAPGDLDQE